jgi:hypothetical protein
MALRGTLKDFGIAEIFQLIGGQGKSGALYLESKKDKLKLLFDKGMIVGVEVAGRDRRGSLTDLLVRAELLTPVQVKDALSVQKQTLRRLPDILREQGLVKPEVLQELMGLEVNEALYGLFAWQAGTYRFEPGEVEYDPQSVTPRSLEHLLMEGFRRVDEWPLILRRIGSFDATFEVVAPLPVRDVSDEVGYAERRVFPYVVPDRDVTTLVDLSRLGEFETCRALQHLLDLGYIRVAERPKTKSRRRRERGARAEKGGGTTALEFLAKGLLSLAAIVLLFLAIRYVNPDLSGVLRPATAGMIGKTEPLLLLGNAQLQRLRLALEVYRLENGSYPESLEDLVQANLVTSGELQYPWEQQYHYRRGEPYLLLQPSR